MMETKRGCDRMIIRDVIVKCQSCGEVQNTQEYIANGFPIIDAECSECGFSLHGNPWVDDDGVEMGICPTSVKPFGSIEEDGQCYISKRLVNLKHDIITITVESEEQFTRIVIPLEDFAKMIFGSKLDCKLIQFRKILPQLTKTQ